MMKVHGKPLDEVFAVLPWQMKLIVVVGCCFIIFTLVYVPYVIATFGDRQVTPGPLEIVSKPPFAGVLDPSLASDGKKSYLAFTGVRAPTKDLPALHTEIHVLSPGDDCEKFNAKGSPAFNARAEEIIGPDGRTPVRKGIWRVETPTLIHDPDDKGREWKLFAYRYFWAENEPLARLYGMIVYSHASDPVSGDWSREEWLFSANAEAPPHPYNQMVRQKLNSLDPSLQHIYFYARPSALYADGVIIMSLSAYIKGRATPDRIVLVSSTDHGATWRYLGTPLNHADADALGYTKLAGATLLMQGGTPVIAAVFGNDATDADGTVIFNFSDVTRGQIVRDESGIPAAPEKIARLSAQPTKTGGGFAAYDDNCAAGILTSEFSGVRNAYQIFKTYRKPLAE